VSFIKYGRLSEAILKFWPSVWGGGGTSPIGTDYWELDPNKDNLPKGLL
jgi:hypothetical protein